MNSSKQRKFLILNLSLAALIISIVMYVLDATGSSKLNYKGVGEGIDLIGSIYNHVIDDYIKEVDPVEVSKNAAEGILVKLDPYSSFLPPIDYNQLREDSEGEFGGLGIEIQQVGEYPRVMSSPIPETPAESVGLRAGDQIINIDSVSTRNMDINDVVARLRGKVGTAVTIQVRRTNHEEPIELTIKRAKIILKNIQYSGEIENGVGYIKLNRFNKEASHEMDEALNNIQKNGNLKGVILDLRGNPGGLLAAAQDIANKFLPKGSLIVFTKGRNQKAEMDLKAQMSPVLHPSVPLVVIVDMGSASASEIVAGAIQDHDRGVLVGATTFGKGSVQTVYEDLPNRAGLKLTTAYYYTPSGRCIHNERNFDENYIASLIEDDDTLRTTTDTEDSLAKRDKFYTLNKQRIVYGGGGVTPDIIVKEKKMGNILIQLYSQSVFFEFAVNYVEKHPDLPLDFTITDEIIKEFKTFIEDEKVFKYTIPGKKNLDDFRKIVQRENYNGDIIAMVDNLEKTLREKREKDFDANTEFIMLYLKRDITAAKFGSRERTVASKEWDIQLKKAIEIINDPARYNSILQLGAKTGVVEM